MLQVTTAIRVYQLARDHHRTTCPIDAQQDDLALPACVCRSSKPLAAQQP